MKIQTGAQLRAVRKQLDLSLADVARLYGSSRANIAELEKTKRFQARTSAKLSAILSTWQESHALATCPQCKSPVNTLAKPVVTRDDPSNPTVEQSLAVCENCDCRFWCFL